MRYEPETNPDLPAFCFVFFFFYSFKTISLTMKKNPYLYIFFFSAVLVRLILVPLLKCITYVLHRALQNLEA